MRQGELLSVAEAQRLVRMPKLVEDPMNWQRKPNHAAFMVCSPPILDRDGIGISGLRLQLERKIPVEVDACLDTYTLFWFAGKRKRRIFQLEVRPCYSKAHYDAGTRRHFYGPHIHYAAESVEDLKAYDVVSNWDCGRYAYWLRRFCRHCHIEWRTEIVDPFVPTDDELNLP